MSVAIAESIDTKRDLIKRVFCKTASNDELELFITACKKYGLDPFSKQIYAIKYGGTLTIQTSIDGFRLIAERTGKYSPGKEPSIQLDDKGKVVSATSYVKKMTADGTWHDVAATAYMEEYRGKSSFWDKMPRLMLAKCAEALALRKAFPAELSGIYTTDEMSQADTNHSVVKEEIVNDIPEIIETFLDDKQKTKMSKLIEEISKKDEKFLANFEDWIEKKYNKENVTLQDIYARDYDSIIQMLQKKHKKLEVEDGKAEVA